MEKIAELAQVIDRHVVGTGLRATAIPRLSLIHTNHMGIPTPVVYDAGL